MAKEKQPKVEQDQEVNDAQMKTEAEAKAIIENNLRFYSQGCEVPADALKPIRAGRLKGMSDVNPMWRMKRMTEIFGPIGFGVSALSTSLSAIPKQKSGVSLYPAVEVLPSYQWRARVLM